MLVKLLNKSVTRRSAYDTGGIPTLDVLFKLKAVTEVMHFELNTFQLWCASLVDSM